jgi:hypothetical protein
VDDSSVATATRRSPRIRGAQFDPGHGTGTWIYLWITTMTLTYRGQKYQQNKQAAPLQPPVLAYRGIAYKK